MSLRLGSLEDALIQAGADRDRARHAAEEVADYARRLTAVRSDLRVLKWLLVAIFAILALSLFVLAERLAN